MPLDLFIRCEAALAWMRIKDKLPGQFLGPRLGHKRYCQSMLDTLQVQNAETDEIKEFYSWNRSYSVDLTSFESGEPRPWGHIEVYTDGSQLRGKTGSGVVIYEDGHRIAEISVHLGENLSVYQGEVFAIKLAFEWLSRHWVKYKIVNVYVDSQAAILALAAPKVYSVLVAQTIDALNAVGDRKCFVCLHWIKAHVGHQGNEEADELAKAGAMDVLLMAADPPAKPKTLMRTEYWERAVTMWSQIWSERVDCRQTKQWMPQIDKNLSFQVIDLDRKVFSKVVQLITGHNYMRRHSSLIGDYPEAECRLCEEEEETSFHVVAECPALARTRMSIFGKPILEEPLQWKRSQVTSLLREAHVGILLDPQGD